jgi:hypothetical protein
LRTSLIEAFFIGIKLSFVSLKLIMFTVPVFPVMSMTVRFASPGAGALHTKRLDRRVGSV